MQGGINSTGHRLKGGISSRALVQGRHYFKGGINSISKEAGETVFHIRT